MHAKARRVLTTTLAAAALTGAGAQAASADGSWIDVDGFAPTSGTPTVMAVDPSTHALSAVVTATTAGAAPRLATFAGKAETRSVPLEAGRTYWDAAIDSIDHTIYLADAMPDAQGGGQGGVSIVSGMTVTRLALDRGLEGRAVAVDEVTHTAYVLLGNRSATSTAGSALAVIRGGARIATIPVAKAATDVAVDSASHLVYVSEGTADTVAVIRGTTVERRITGIRSPGALAVDPGTHVLYVTPALPLEPCYGLGCISNPLLTLYAVDGAAIRSFSLQALGWVLGLAVDPVRHEALAVIANGQLVVAGDRAVLQVVGADVPVGGSTVPEYAGAPAVDPGAAAYRVVAGAVRRTLTSDRPRIEQVTPPQILFPDQEPERTRRPIVTAVFSQAMDREYVEAAFSVTGPSGPVTGGTFAWFGARVMVWQAPAGIPGSSDFTATMSGLARDAAGRPLIASRSWSFATAGTPRLPSLQLMSPRGGLENCVYPGTPFYVQATDLLDPAPIESYLLDRARRRVPGHAAALGGIVFGYLPDQPLPLGFQGTFGVTGAVYEGQRLGDVSLDFAIVAAPSLAAVGPVDGATGVSTTAPPIYLVFGQPMDLFTVAYTVTLTRVKDGQPVPGTVTFLGDQIAGFKPSAPLAPGEQYTAKITDLARDKRYCQLPGTTTWSFTTAAAGATATPVALGAAPAPTKPGVGTALRVAAR